MATETREAWVQYVQDHMPTAELFALLAEEAAELAHAALKMRRALDGTNPTPVSVVEAWGQLLEELADVLLVFDVLEGSNSDQILSELSRDKLARWVARLEAKEAEA